MKRRLGLLAGSVLLSLATSASADKPLRTWNYLTTGNGHGFQIFDTNKNKITHFLEAPYRYLRPRSDPRSDGYGRRNLAYDFYFGLRGPSGGGWLNGGTAGDASYVEETNIIKVPITLAGISAETYYFSPFGFEGNAMIAILKATSASEGFALFNFHMGDGSPDTPNANGERLKVLSDGKSIAETGVGGGAMIYVPITAPSRIDCDGVYNKVSSGQSLGDNRTCSGTDIVPAFQATLDSGHMAVATLFVENEADAESMLSQFKTWLAGRGAAQLLTDALAEWTAWRKPLPQGLALCTEDEKKLWRQSEAVLRMGQVRQPNTASRKNNGMVLASLPPGEWHTGWVRDALYAVVALARMGHFAETKMALNFFLNAEPVSKFSSYVSGASYRISVCRYFGTGEEEGDYSGQQTPNVEIDGWGMMLWAARQYVDASGDTAWLSEKVRGGVSVYDALYSGVAEPLRKNTESSGIAKADSSIWEVHDENKKHFAYTTLATIRGFCDFAQLANKASKASDATTYRGLASKARDGFLASFLDRDGAIAGSIEELAQNQYLDGAVVEAFTWNVLRDAEYLGRTGKATLDVLGRLRVESGGFKRNDDGKSSYDNNEWILIDMRIADALWRAGREGEAAGIMKMLIDKASANYNLLPELYNAVRADGAVGKYAGSIPMVGYGGGAYVLTMLDRSGLIEPNDCGDGMGNKSSGRALKCSDEPVTPTNPGSPNTPSADEIPFENACLCGIGARHGSPSPWVFFSASAMVAVLLRRRLGRGGRS